MDPTLQFTALGQSNTGDVIDGGLNANSQMGQALASGDFNADGRVDLAIGATSYATNTGRVYIFYNDGSIPTTAVSADVIITGETTDNKFGASLSAGDFNTDGKIDLAVGASNYVSSTGRAYIFYNDGSIPTTAASADVIITGEATNNYFGQTLISGDFNNDSRIDLAVGTNGYSTSTGRAYIFYNDGSIPATAASADVIITGEATNNYFGQTLISGDFNNDSRMDIAVGAYGYSTNTGRAYIFYNDGSIPTTAASADVIITGETTSNNFGISLSAGDFNNDSRTDLAIGASGYSTNIGCAYIFYNDGSIPTTASSADVIITDGEATNNYFGQTLISGDFNNDSRMDIAVGAYGYSTNTGRAYIFYNDGSIPTTAASADVIITGEATNNYFSRYGLISGDFNNDSRIDLAVGSDNYSSGAGRVYIFYNDGSIPTTAVSADVIITGETNSFIDTRFGYKMISGDFNADGKTDLVVSTYTTNSSLLRVFIFYNDGSFPTTAATADVIINEEQAGSEFGHALGSGDFNADGKTDLVVGARNFLTGTGRIYIFYNDGTYPTDAGNADIIITGTAISNYFGGSFASADFNADGRDDLVVGAELANSVYIFYNDGAYPTVASSADKIITGSFYFGTNVAVGDLNSDGKKDLISCAYAIGGNTGALYIFYNDGSMPTTAATADVIINGEAGSLFGTEFSIADFNGDGRDDLATEAPYYSTNTGRAYIFYNDGSIPTTASSADVIITGEATNDNFGHKVISGDFNSDGRIDLAVLAWGYSTSTGRAYIFYNDGSIPTTAATADVIITGETLNSRFGYAFTVGDFNTDGKIDLAVGAYRYSTSAGRVYIFYSQNGQINTNKIITGEADGYFGHAMTAGDFNGDGKIDLAVGSYAYSGSTGRVYIFYNDGNLPNLATAADVTITGEAASAFGFILTAGDLNADGKTDLVVGASSYSASTGRAYIFYNDGSIPTTAATADVIITGESTSSQFGISLAMDDLNSDGKNDLVVGANIYASDAGRAYIFYGDGTNNFGSVACTGASPTLCLASNGDIKISGEASSRLGLSMITGDFNADGRMDLAIGSVVYNSNQGRVYIFYNDGSIPTTAATADAIITGEATNNNFGQMASGDFNADGKTDLAVGALQYATYTGRAYIFYSDGTNDFGTVACSGSAPTLCLAANADIIINGEATNSYFGGVLVSGDFNADGRTDLAVAGRGYATDTGRAYIFYNDGSIPTTAATADVIITGETTSNFFGRAMTSGDFNADGKTDLVVGAYGYSTNTGRAYIYETRNDYAWQMQEQDSTTRIHGIAGQEMKITGEDGAGKFGYGMTTGDFNADGKIDLAVGAWSYASNTGRTYIFYNDGSLTANAFAADEIITGETSSQFGQTMIAGDLNADGKTDLIVGAPGYASSTGRTYIFYNDGSYPREATSAEQIITGESGGFGEYFGIGDFTADGKSDLVVGAKSYNANTGRIYLFSGDGTIPSDAAYADTIITGEATNDYFGSSFTNGDFNADGKTDLAVGATGYFGNTGRTYIFYNDGSLPTDSGQADVKILGEAANNYFGRSLSSGDFNADGKVDLAVGADGYTSNTGRAYIFYNDGSIPVTAATADVTITGEATSNWFGTTTVSGDFNADGKTDLSIGGPGYASSIGRAYIFYNDGTIPTTATTADVAITGQSTGDSYGTRVLAGDINYDGKTDLIVGANNYNSNTGRVYLYTFNDMQTLGASTSTNFGSAMLSGDFNADGKTDLAVGAWTYATNTGRVYVFYNQNEKITPLAANADVIITGEATNNEFGGFLEKGDFNADGKMDFAVGAPGYSTNTGRIYMFYNDGAYTTAAATADKILTGGAINRYLGRSIVAADFNADGKVDLGVGTTGYVSNSGAAYIYYNTGTAINTIAGTTITGTTAADNFGNAVESADFNADGKMDLVVGAYGRSTSTGYVYIFYCDGTIPATAATADVIIAGEAINTNFGVALSTGDLDADGKKDLIVGASGYSSNTGRTYIFYNDGSIPTTADTANMIITGENVNDAFGGEMIVGDFNADGKTDLVVGASGYSTNTGKVYYFYNDGSMTGFASQADIKIDGETTNNYFGGALTQGDYNSDGKTDLAVGAYGYSTNTGKVYTYMSETNSSAGIINTAKERGSVKMKGNVKMGNITNKTCAEKFHCGCSIVYGGQTYNTVSIDSQCWFKENLNVGTMITGITMPSDPAPTLNNPATVSKWCYGDIAGNCTTYGGLYSWAETNGLASTCNTTTCTPPTNNQGICPTGWHIPSDQEYMKLEEYLGMCSGTGAGCSGATGWRGTNQGTNLKSGGSSNWNGLLAGARYNNGTFSDQGTTGYFWPATESSSTTGWYRLLSSSNASVYRTTPTKIYGFSVRCVQN